MVPDIAIKGRSFKGAFAYYLHDKRQEGETARMTAERVAWTETRNLATDGPETAKRIMIATASQADELKKAAGVKNTGRKSNQHVYAYSLAWHPDEAGNLDRAEMVRAVDASLKALEADHLQAVLVCHQDQKHPHVHVILNRVDPATGKMHGFSNDREKLSAWAAAYERERGQIVTPKRQEKHPEQERAAPAFEKAAKPAQERPADPPAQKPRLGSEGSLLKDLSDAQKVRHKQEWADLAARNKAKREAVYSDHGRTIAAAIEQHKTATRPAWSVYFKAARMSEQAFFAREQSIVGKLQNAIAATPLGVRGSLSTLFGNVLSASSREAAFRAAQETSRGHFAQTVKSRLDGEIAALRQQRGAALAAQRQTYNAERAALIVRQDSEKAKMREAWRQVYERKGKDPRYLADRARKEALERQTAWKQQREAEKATRAANQPRTAYQGRPPLSAETIRKGVERKEQRAQNARRTMEQKPVEKDFDKARQLSIATPTPAPVKQQALTMPAPQPTPAGVPTPPARTVQEVPKVDRAAEWAKTAQGRAELAKTNPTPAPARDFAKSAAPATPAQAPTEPKPMSRAEYWNAQAKAKSADREQAPERDRSKDRDFDRER